MNADVILIIEGSAYRLGETGRLETCNIGGIAGQFRVTDPTTRNMSPGQDAIIKDELLKFGLLFPSHRRTAVQQKSMSKGKREKQELPRANGRGSVSKYTCTICRKYIITKDVDEGTVHPQIPCNQTKHCRGSMRPTMYTGKEKPEYIWRLPTDEEAASPGNDFLNAYYKNGGMILTQEKAPVEA